MIRAIAKTHSPRIKRKDNRMIGQFSTLVGSGRLAHSLGILWIVAMSLWPASLVAETPDCVTTMSKQIIAGTLDSSSPVCPAITNSWEIRLHDRIGQVGFLVDGTALGILHLPQRSDVSVEEWPLPVVLLPVSDHVWSINELYRGEVLYTDDPMRFFLWTPGNSRNGYQPNGVDWGDDSARLFRCTAKDSYEKCITYYPIPNCIGDRENYDEVVISARQESSLNAQDLLDTFEHTDEIMRLIAESAWIALCGGKK
jgi:hypothetical protein